MKEVECVVPVKCMSCSAVFDLWRELLSQEQHGAIQGALSGRMDKREFLCPSCRMMDSKTLEVEIFAEDELELSWG